VAREEIERQHTLRLGRLAEGFGARVSAACLLAGTARDQKAVPVAAQSGLTGSSDFEALLLRDIRDLFDQKRVDRLASAAIVEHLNLLPHGLWADWRGRDDTEAPRPMTTAIMAKLLAVFLIRPATIWPLGRNTDSKSSRGYHRHQFEDAWNRYCSEPGADTPTHSSKIKAVRGT
jgi:hypothetical protein